MRNIWIHAVCGNDLLASCFKLEVLFSSAQIQKPNFSKAAIIFPPWSVSIYFCAHVYFRVQFDSAKPPVLTPCICVCVCVCQTVCKAFQTTGRAPPAVHLHSPVSSRTRWISSSVQVCLVDSLCNQSAQPLQWVSCKTNNISMSAADDFCHIWLLFLFPCPQMQPTVSPPLQSCPSLTFTTLLLNT